VPPAIAVPSAASTIGTIGRHVRNSAFHGRSPSLGKAGLHVDADGVAGVAAGHLLEVRSPSRSCRRAGEESCSGMSGSVRPLDAGVVHAAEHSPLIAF